MEIKMGRKVKDLVTGFTGIVTGKAIYLNGCTQYLVETKVNKDGELKWKWFDENQLKDLGPGIKISKSKKGKPPGGPMEKAPMMD